MYQLTPRDIHQLSVWWIQEYYLHICSKIPPIQTFTIDEITVCELPHRIFLNNVQCMRSSNIHIEPRIDWVLIDILKHTRIGSLKLFHCYPRPAERFKSCRNQSVIHAESTFTAPWSTRPDWQLSEVRHDITFQFLTMSKVYFNLLLPKLMYHAMRPFKTTPDLCFV